jgi:hypothetical protein
MPDAELVGAVAVALILLLSYVAVFGCLAAAIAFIKNRNVSAWFLLGAGLGPLAFVAVLGLPALEDDDEGQRQARTPPRES